MDVLTVSVLPTALLSCSLFQEWRSSSVSPLAQCVMGCKARLEEAGKAFPTPLQALCACTGNVGIREQLPQGKVGKGAVISKSMLRSLCLDSLGISPNMHVVRTPNS